MEFYRIIIADDQPMHRESLEKTLIRVLPSATVFNASGDKQVLEIISKAIIDLIFLKIDMQSENIFEIIKEIRKANPDIKIVAVKSVDDKTDIIKMIDAGVSGFITQNIEKHELKNAINAVSNGDLYLPEEVSE